MKTSELIDASLDYWVMRALGYKRAGEFPLGVTGCFFDGSPYPWSPSESWAQAGPIIEHNGITVVRLADKTFRAMYNPITNPILDLIEGDHEQDGDTYLVAAMRAYVASKFGNEIVD